MCFNWSDRSEPFILQESAPAEDGILQSGNLVQCNSYIHTAALELLCWFFENTTQTLDKLSLTTLPTATNLHSFADTSTLNTLLYRCLFNLEMIWSRWLWAASARSYGRRYRELTRSTNGWAKAFGPTRSCRAKGMWAVHPGHVEELLCVWMPNMIGFGVVLEKNKGVSIIWSWLKWVS